MYAMRVLILAGGLGTRISEETSDKPKPMVAINGKPILAHLMDIFSVQGFCDFVLALGYRGDVIKRWLKDLNDLEGNIVVDTARKSIIQINNTEKVSWKITALETGIKTQTGGRIRHCMSHFPNERLIVTYGDGLANVNINKLLEFHENHGKLATVTAVRPPARFGYMKFSEKNLVEHFGEKNQLDEGWINGGFFILEPEVANYIEDDFEPFETGAIIRLVKNKQLMSFRHEGFWQPMDTLREKNELERLASLSTPPWLENI